MIHPRVLIADDHAATREGVRTLLQQAGFRVCAEVGAAQEAIDAAVRERPDACVIGLIQPGDGVHAIREITSRLPTTAVVVFTSSATDADLFAAIHAGARGYLLKDADAAELPVAVRAAIAGDGILSGPLTRRVLEALRHRGPGDVVQAADGHAVRLSRRGQEVFELLAEGLSTAEIAHRLGCSAVTVRRHISLLERRLGVSSREEILQIARNP